MRFVSWVAVAALTVLPAGLCAEEPDMFTITFADGRMLTHESEKARVYLATDQIWDLRAEDVTLRYHAFRLDGEPIAQSKEVGQNNTFLQMNAEIGGETRKISCRASLETPFGEAQRTELTDTRVSGEFFVNFEICGDSMTNEVVELDFLPLAVKAVFSVNLK